MIAMVSPGNSDVEHTLNTLRYADRVKELNVDELKQRGAEIHQKHNLNDHENLQTLYESDANDDYLDDYHTDLMPSSRSNNSKVRQPQNNKRLAGNQQSKRRFEQAIARSHEVEDSTLESHHKLIDDLPQIVSNHQGLLDLSTNMNYDREDYAKKLIHLIDNQQKHLTQLRTKALQMREAVAYEDLCAKALSSK
jgi:kinesin family protein 2/24